MAAMGQAIQQPPDEGARARPSVDWHAALTEHARWLRTVVFSRLGEPEAVEEVLQEVALAAVRQSAPLADVTKVGPWLYRLAVRHCLLYRRKCGRRRKLTERFADRFQPQEHDCRVPDPLAWLLADERRSLVRTALARLPAQDAEILLLKYTENWSYHQIATQLGVSHSAVESRLHRARKRMRDQLAALQLIEVRQ